MFVYNESWWALILCCCLLFVVAVVFVHFYNNVNMGRHHSLFYLLFVSTTILEFIKRQRCWIWWPTRLFMSVPILSRKDNKWLPLNFLLQCFVPPLVLILTRHYRLLFLLLPIIIWYLFVDDDEDNDDDVVIVVEEVAWGRQTYVTNNIHHCQQSH